MINDRNQLFQQYRRARHNNEGLRSTPPAPDGLRHAAVLVPVIDRPKGLQLLLIERAAHLKHHAGQIGFPGGAVERADASTLACALREAEEEIGLRPNQVDVLGPLPSRVTAVSSYFIQPFLALVYNYTADRIDQNEVSDVFEVALNEVLDPARHELITVNWQGEAKSFYQIQIGDKRIWGATAGMIVEMSRMMWPELAPVL